MSHHRLEGGEDSVEKYMEFFWAKKGTEGLRSRQSISKNIYGMVKKLQIFRQKKGGGLEPN